MTPQEKVAIACDGYQIPGKSYPTSLPAEVSLWYVYIVDGGHSILCTLEEFCKPGLDIEECMIPMPVKTVLRSYRIVAGCVVVPLAYDKVLGVQVPEEDTEF